MKRATSAPAVKLSHALRRARGISSGRDRIRGTISQSYEQFRRVRSSASIFKKAPPLTEKQRAEAIDKFIAENGVTKCPMRVVWA